MIAGLLMVKDDADVVGATLAHTLDQGVDRVLISLGDSSDDTAGVIYAVMDEFGHDRVTIYENHDELNRQVFWMNFLLNEAQAQGADWLCPFDADEWVYATDGSTIAQALADVPEDVPKLFLRHWQHFSWDRRNLDMNRWRKVVFRATPGAVLEVGNHNVSINGGTEGVLDLREFCYRSFEHFKAKAAARNANIPPEVDGWHHRRLVGLNEQEMAHEWQKLISVPTIADPIPSKYQPGYGRSGQAP